MEKFKNLFSGLKMPTKDEIKKAVNTLSKKEYAAFLALFAVLIVSTMILVSKINNFFLQTVPASGGSLSEGIVGAPRFVNPVLALSDADKDMTALVYSGLMRKMGDGEIVPDLAEKYDISQDGLNYTFTLKKGLTFHDKKPLTADDVVFTINKVKDPNIKSPRKLNWEGVTATKIDDLTVEFALKQPYSSFLSNLTIGILPAHLWKDISPEEFSFAELNIKAVGSGPYKVSSVKNKSSGIPDYYQLQSFNNFALGKPFIDKLTVNFYPGEKDLIKALQGGSVEQAGAITPENAGALKDRGFRIETSVLPRIFGIFFNQNQSPLFADKSVVEAFEKVINKDEIVDKVLYGYGTAISSPIPKNMVSYESWEGVAGGENKPTDEELAATKKANIDAAVKILADDGWKLNADGVMEKAGKKKSLPTDLEFSLSTGDAPELTETADLIKADLESIGARVDLKIYDISSLNQDIIRPRKYDALLFGEIVNNEGDLFAFWHSSQRNDPGLNIAMYTNVKADKILEDSLGNLDPKTRLDKYAQFEREIEKDKPAIFIYSPEFVYVVASDIKGLIINKITNPADRFSEIYKWYRESDKIWKIFNSK
jgi:peptide/nickel transport system substrate-binding protein